MTEIRQSAIEIARRIYRGHPLAVGLILALALGTMLLEGFGLALILPIIEGLDSPGGVTAEHEISRGVGRFLGALGVPFALPWLFAVGFGTYLLLAILNYLRVDLVARTGASFVTELRRELFSELMASQIDYFHKRKVGDLTNVTILEADRARAAFHFLVDVVVTGMLLLVYLAASVLISWRLFLIAGGFGVVFLLVTRRGSRAHQSGKDVSTANDLMHSRTVEHLIGIREVKVFGLEGRAAQAFGGAAWQSARAGWILSRLTARFRLMYDGVAVMLLLGVIALSFTVVALPPTELAAFLLVVFRLLPRLTGLQSAWDNFMGTLPGFESVQALQKDARAHQAVVPEAADKRAGVRSQIALEDVSFTYFSRKEPALSHVNLSFPRGKTVALVGSSGAGKSTLVDLLIRFHDPTTGRVLVDGHDLRGIDLATWRGAIGYVSQDTFLFHDTILENIRIGRPGATEEEVRAAARMAHAEDFILGAPAGYATVVGDRGATLSGGQRQRIALARAYLRNPDVLILDEPTSDLDSKSEKLIQDSLEEFRKGRTVIIIAHRLATIEHADSIALLENGRVVETGTHAELMSKGSSYSQYVRLQMGARGDP